MDIIYKALICFAAAFAAAVVIGQPIIHYLQKMKFGQRILEIGPKWHMSKQYTPTMGGIIIILSIVTVMLFALFKQEDSLRAWFVIAFALIFGIIGMIDDLTKIKKKQNMGLTATQKFILQLVAAALFISAMRFFGYLSTEIYVPFFNISFNISWYVYMPAAAFVIVGTVNAVNLTDGIDGLAASVTLIVSAFFAAVFYLWHMDAMLIFCACTAGALLGFLMYNFNPAKVFMGDAGSLFLGGIVCGLAFAADMPLILIPVGIIYIMETLSVILQVVYFKITNGKRLFKMAPIHHHFEMCGWKEKKIVIVFASATVFMCIIAYLGVCNRFMP